MPVLKDKTCAICGASSTYSGKYAACPECALKIHKAKASDFSQKYQDKEFLEVLKRYGGDNFGSAYEAAIEKVKSAHQKSMSNPKLNSSCCICGSPCHKFKAKYSTCVECALKVWKKFDAKCSKPQLKTFKETWEAYGGEGFTAKEWGDLVEQVKEDHAKATAKVHFDCYSSPGSVCVHGAVPKQERYLVKGSTTKNAWEEVRLCQDHYDKRIENGWLNGQWQALSDKTPKLTDLKKGQRVEFEILAGDDKGYRGWATVIQDGTDNAYIYWDLPNKTSWATNGSRLEAVKELGLKPEGKNVWACFPDQLKVLRAFQPMNIPKPVVFVDLDTPPAVATKLSDLKKGQRVQLQGKSGITKGLVGWAVVIKDGAKPVVYWEDKAPTGAWEGEHNHGAILRQYGLDPLLQRCWYCYDDDIEVLQVEDVKPKSVPALDLKDFKEGQRLQITHRKGYGADHTTWATVVLSHGTAKHGVDNTLLYFDEEGGGSWKDLSDFSVDEAEAKAAVGRLGLDVNGKFRYCKSEDTTILEKAPEIKIKDLEVGDRLHVHLERDKHYTWATVVVSGSNPILHLDSPAKGADGKNIALAHITIYDVIAREYGLPEGAYYWGILEGCQTKILGKGKKLEKVKKVEPPKDAFADFKEGDRLKIQHEGHTTWATVVQEAISHTGVLLLYYDTPSLDSYPRENSGDVIASCKKLGLDPTKNSFRKVLSASTTILEKAPAIVPQELQVGDRVQVEARNKDVKHLTWATVIKTGFYPVLHVDIQVPESIGSGSWRDSDHDMVAKTLGLPTVGKHYWTAYSDQIQFLTKAGSYLPPEKSKPKLADCKAGERIQVEYLSKTTWATVVLPEGQDIGYGTATVLYFDPPVLQGWSLDADKSTHKHLFPAAENLGLDATQRLFRRCYGDDTKVLERRSVPALKDLKQGDRVYVSIKDKIKTWATVIRADTTPVLHLDTAVNESFGKSWDSEYWDANVASSYGLKSGTSNYWTAADSTVQILTQGMSLPKVEISNVASEADKQEKEPEMKTKYRVGEKLRIKIEWHDKELDAHVIETDDNDTILWLEDKSGCGWKPTRKATVETVQRLGLGRGGAMNCYTMDDDVKIVKRYDQISEETKKGEEDMSKRKWKVGDRVKIKTTSIYPFTGWGTIISLKGLDGDPNQPLLFMDEEQDDTWPWDEESQRKAAIKAGLDPEKASFWWLCEDDDTEVLEKEEEKMEEKNFMGMVKSDAVEAGYRVASTQMTKGVKAGLLRMFKDKGADAGKLVIVQELLDSEVGSAVIALIMGHGMGYIPKLNEDPRFQKLAKEFRIGGMSTAGNVLMDTVMQYLAPAVMDAVSNLPPVGEVVNTVSEKAGIKKKTKKRIAPVVRVKDAPKLEEHEEEESKKEALAATG